MTCIQDLETKIAEQGDKIRKMKAESAAKVRFSIFMTKISGGYRFRSRYPETAEAFLQRRDWQRIPSPWWSSAEKREEACPRKENREETR